MFVLKDQSSLFLLCRIVRKVLISKVSMTRFDRGRGDDRRSSSLNDADGRLLPWMSTKLQLMCQIIRDRFVSSTKLDPLATPWPAD